MKIILFFLLCNNVASLKPNNWTPLSWKTKNVYQDIVYPDLNELNTVTEELSNCAPLIFAGEANNLKEELISASRGEAFILMGGDCAETFREFKVENIMNTYRILLQMTSIFMYSMSKPVVKIGRMAGQYAKPRSEVMETINGITLHSYRGDIVNLEQFDEKSRIPNPQLMIKAYSQSVQTMNLIRALSQGGYADINRVEDWNLNFMNDENNKESYTKLSNEIKKTLGFMKAVGINKIEETSKARFYTAHEALLLPYESALTRVDSITKMHYGCSAHMLWVGERTRQIDGAHIEYLRGIQNPIGIKISEKCDPYNLEELLRLLNPDNEEGKIVLISRMGNKVYDGLPPIASMIKRRKLNVVLVCDPMHGNTIKLDNGIKTRYLEDIKREYTFFHNCLLQHNIYPGGIHLEMTGRNVTECLYKNSTREEIDNIKLNYESSCDPRLSASQCLDLAFYISELANI